MGAIFGILGEADGSELARMSARLVHRGGQGEVWAVAPHVHFGQRACAAEGEAFVPPARPIAFEGLLNNRDELVTILGYAAARARPSDADLVFELYEKLGAEAFRHITGQFAAAIWDAREGRLVLARDASATRPLYFTRAGERYLFATEYKALLAVDSVPARPNRDAIQHLHNTKYVQADACCLADVFPVPGGSCVYLTEAGHVARRYEDLAIPVSRRSGPAHADALQQSLLGAAERQTREFTSIGVALSAGLDSALTVAAVRRVAPDKSLHTFTAGFGPDDGDVAEAAAVARHFSTSHHEVFLSPDDLPALLPRTIWHMEDPIGREEKVFYHVVAREAAKHVPLLLAGHNADALFAGMPRHLLAKAGLSLPLVRRPFEELYQYTQSGIRPQSMIGRMLVHAYCRGAPVPPPRVHGAAAPPNGAGFPRGTQQPLTALLRDGILLDPNAHSAIERIHAGASIPFDSLFLDLDVIRCSMAIPDPLKIRGWRRKYILRRASVGLLPDAMLRRRKGLLRLRRDVRLSNVLDELAATFLCPEAVAARGLFAPAYVDRIRRRPASGIYGVEQIYRLWSLLLTELWSRLFLDARGAPPN